jgi:hypothetical protein
MMNRFRAVVVAPMIALSAVPTTAFAEDSPCVEAAWAEYNRCLVTTSKLSHWLCDVNFTLAMMICAVQEIE